MGSVDFVTVSGTVVMIAKITTGRNRDIID